jgi:hypothetical protein
VPVRRHEKGDASVTMWTSDELNRIGTAEELQIASRRTDGTLRNSVIVWVVRHGGDLYIRSVNGPTSAWFRGTQTCHEGRVWAGGVEKDITFVEETDLGVNDGIDAAYGTKYRRYPGIIPSMVTPEVRSTTLKLVPRVAT